MSRPVTHPRAKLTHDDYLLLPDDGLRHEILDGRHYVTASPVTRHQRVSMNLALLLAAFCREHELGEVLTAPLDVILSRHDVAQPDLVFVSTARSEILQDWVRGAPDLVIEILSPSTRRRDETLKRRIYRERGVLEYWIVDPDAETVKVWNFGGDSPEGPALLTGKAGLTSDLLPGLEIPLGRIFD